MTAGPTPAALAALLGEAAPAAAPPSLARQVTAQLALLLANAGDRLASLRTRLLGDAEGSIGTTRSDAAPGAARAEAPAPLLQPPPPLATYTLDPELGTIVDAGASDGSAAGGRFGAGSDDDGVEAGPPTSWVPIAGFGLRTRIGSHVGALVDRVDALLDEIGVTRLQLLLLMVVAPLATAFVIEVVATLLESR